MTFRPALPGSPPVNDVVGLHDVAQGGTETAHVGVVYWNRLLVRGLDR